MSSTSPLGQQPPTTAGRRPLKTRDWPFFRALAARLARADVSPDAISFLSMIFAGGAGAALTATASTTGAVRRACWLAAIAGIQLRLVANMLDGLVAVEGRRGGPLGDLWNEAPDRVSDAIILIGAGYAAHSYPWLGFGAALVAVFVAYVRALGASVGAGQVFLGPQAKPHRMAVLTGACVLGTVWPDLAWPSAGGALSFISLALTIVILGGLLTAWRRLRRIAATLRSGAR